MAEMNLSHSIVVNAPIEEVFQAFTDPEIRKQWFPNPPETRDYEPPLEVGKQWETISTLLGRELTTKYTVTKYEPPHLDVRSIDGPATGEIRHVVEEVEGGIKVSVIFNGKMKGFLASLAAPLLKARLNKQMENDLESFKNLVES